MSQKLSLDEKEKLYQDVLPIAIEYRRTFIDEMVPIKDSFSTLEQLGFLILRFPALQENKSLAGFTIYKRPYHCIYINSRQNLGRQYLSCWHECYHAISGEGNGLSYISSDDEDSIEYKANVFAGIILMPDNLVKNYMDIHNFSVEYLKYTQIIKMQNYFRVSYSAMLTRLIQLYPEAEFSLKKRYAICKNTVEAKRNLIKKTKEIQGDLRLIQPTNDIYIPQTLFENIEFNMKEKRITKEKAYELLKLIDGLADDSR